MADQTMKELLQAPTEGYGEAIVIPEILAENFEIKTNLLQLVQTNKFHSFERDNPHTHISNFKRMTSTLKYRDVPNDAIKLMLFLYSLEGPLGFGQDSLNATTGGNLLSKTTREALKIIENKSKVRYSKGKSNVSRVNTNSSNQSSVCAATGTYNQVSPPNRASNQMAPPGFAPMQNNQNRYNQNQRNNFNRGNNFQGNQGYRDPMNHAPNFQNQGFQNQPFQAPNNHVQQGIPNGEMKAVTTLSGLAYEGPSISTNSSPEKIVERETEETTDKQQPTCQGSTAYIQTLVVPTPISELVVSKTQSKPNIPYPSRLNDQRLREKATNQMEKFFQIFHDLHFYISFADALLLMPKFASINKGLLTNKDKLFELDKVPLNENCSAMLLKSFPKSLEIPANFLFHVICQEWISITRPKRVAEDVYVKVGKFHFPTDFVVVDFKADPRVPLILGRSFLRTSRALIDVYGEEITLQVNDESTKEKSSIEKPPELELKELPSHLEYAFLEETDKLPVIIAKDLKDDEKEALLKVLKSHKRAIAWKITDIKGIDPRFCIHKILMEEDYKPEVQSQRRVNPKIHWVIKKEVIKLLDAEMIYPIFDSPWVSPVHCVPKKGGMTVVANENNELILTRLVADPQDQEKTTFTCPYGTFAYRRMPFGLCNALGTFQRCMISIFHDMIEKTMEVFMDDFSGFGDSFSSCLSNLDKMLKRCKDTNLVLNWEKCHFMCKEGIVLGHKISKSKIEVDRAKVDVIAKFPHSTTVKGVRIFLGHADFYQRFIQDLSKIARPMTHLLEKETPFVFSKDYIDAFETLKKKLTEAPILVVPD
nr:DNA-directed DNA polymerase [Tanacetum cinerariifolium]